MTTNSGGGGSRQPRLIGPDDALSDLSPEVVAAIEARLLNIDAAGTTVTTLDGRAVDPFTGAVSTDAGTIPLTTHIQRQFGTEAAFFVASAVSSEPIDEAVDEEVDPNVAPEQPDQTTIGLPGVREFLGVPNDFQAVKIFDPQQFGQEGPPSTTIIPPEYKPGDEIRAFTGLSVEQIALIQDRMVEAGVLNANSIRAGIWDQEVSAPAMAAIMGQANFDGLTWSAELNNLRDKPLPENALDQFQRQPFTRPNRTEIESDISKSFQQEMFRKPTKAELDDLADMWQNRLRLSHEASQDDRFYEDLAERKRAEGDELVAGAGQRLEEIESPESAFNRHFEAKFGDSIRDIGQREKDIAQGRGLSDQLRFLGSSR